MISRAYVSAGRYANRKDHTTMTQRSTSAWLLPDMNYFIKHRAHLVYADDALDRRIFMLCFCFAIAWSLLRASLVAFFMHPPYPFANRRDLPDNIDRLEQSKSSLSSGVAPVGPLQKRECILHLAEVEGSKP